MPTVLLVRHGRSTANSSGILAGWSPGVALDDRGREQAASMAGRLAVLPVSAVVSSPLQRCQETVAPLLEVCPDAEPHTDDRIGECHYGDWSGRKLSELADEPLWRTVQQYPSQAAFPGPEGESLRAMQIRAVDCVREWNARIEEQHGADAVFVMCSHGDVIKSVVADALGLHLDLFQRIAVDPCSVTAIRYTSARPFLVRLGDTGDLAALAPPPEGAAKGAPEGDAAVGGGAGAP
jgi:probable phosphomutase (TIGR03848 family)